MAWPWQADLRVSTSGLYMGLSTGGMQSLHAFITEAGGWEGDAALVSICSLCFSVNQGSLQHEES